MLRRLMKNSAVQTADFCVYQSPSRKVPCHFHAESLSCENDAVTVLVRSGFPGNGYLFEREKLLRIFMKTFGDTQKRAQQPEQKESLKSLLLFWYDFGSVWFICAYITSKVLQVLRQKFKARKFHKCCTSNFGR